ncbi:UNVERIFIED_CONTAM: putative F-box protein [Sesamum angustifolium]|uniref:F-box protein n=1 Tax=Sesamum angustifolium TaxID=2727405 RepID=A0AAW2N4E9_9LAMI
MVEMKGIGYLPRDMIIEILSRLPAKVLCKFRCVSKSWNDLLTRDVEFMTRHVQWSKQKPLLLVRRYLSDGIGELNKSKITIELTSIDMQGDVTDKFRKVIDGPVHTFVSCGPLSILCCMYSLYVCNPSIHQVVRVPYHANSRLYNIGFGYLPVSNEYKIVHMFYHSFVGNGKMGCEIFSFKTGEGVTSGSWRGIGDCPFSAWTDEYPVCVNGTIYWALSSGWKDKSILSLDLEKEEFSSEASTMDIWMLKDKKNKTWAIEYSINLFPLCPKFLVPSEDHSEEILVHMEQRDLICYSLKSQTSRTIGYYRAMKTYNKPCLYYGSLIPMHSTSF